MTQAIIRGSFRGRGKRSVWIDENSIVIVADSGLGGSAEFEIMALLSSDEIRDIRKVKELDPRILATDVMDASQLMTDCPILSEPGFEFDGANQAEVDVDNI